MKLNKVMKNIITVFMAAIMFMNIGASAYATVIDENNKNINIGDYNPNEEYKDYSDQFNFKEDISLEDQIQYAYPDSVIVEQVESEFGTIYYVKRNEGGDIQGISFWDITDIIMAGASWAEMFGQPSWANLGWAALDTVALLPLIPSSAYFRKGGKVILKLDEIKKFAKTQKGYEAIRKAMIIGDKFDDVKDLARSKWLKNLRNYMFTHVNRFIDIPSFGKINPKVVRFTQDSIGKKFSNGKLVSEVIEQLKKGKINPNDFPPIKIFNMNGKYYSLDNRRLYAFKEAGIDITYQIVDKMEAIKDAWKFTTVNDGMSIIVRK